MTKRLAGAIDITVETFPGMVVYPGECETQKEFHFTPAPGQPITCTHWSLTAHAGTHLDAPRHFDPRGRAIAEYPPDFFEFRAAVLDATALRAQRRHADAAFIESKRALLDGCDAVLVKTHHGELWRAPAFDEGHTAIAHDAAALLAREGRFRLVGIDYFSVEPWGVEVFDTHLSFLLNGIFILEGLDLSRIGEGAYTLICLPAKWRDAEAAPTRALLIP